MKIMLIVVEEIIKKLLKITGKILEVRNMVYLMKKFIRLHQVLVMMKEYN